MARILFVDDDVDLAHLMEADLRADGYKVETVSDGEAALKRASAGVFDLIVLDLELPKKDGRTVCRELRTLGCKTPILMLTGKRTEEADRVLGLDLGADDYVTKPFGNHELRARIRALLRRTKTDLTDVYRFGEVEVDFGRAEVRLDGKPVGLTQTEYKLLRCFIEAQGKILVRDQILERVWGRSVGGRAIDSVVMHLRSKLEPDPQQPIYFINVRGLGYRFEGGGDSMK